MNCSTPGLPVLHYTPELVQTHVRWVGDAIQSSHLLSSPSSPALSLSHHQRLFPRVGSSYQVAKVLELQVQHQSFQWIFRVDFLEDWLVWSPCHPRDSQESSLAPHFETTKSFALKPFLWSNSHIHTWLLEKPWLWLYGPSLEKWCLCFLYTV